MFGHKGGGTEDAVTIEYFQRADVFVVHLRSGPQQGYGVLLSGGDCSLHGSDGEIHRGKGAQGRGTHPQDQTACLVLVR